MNGSQTVTVAASGDGVVVVEPKVSGEILTITDNTFTIPEGGVTNKNLKTSEDAYSIKEVKPPTGYQDTSRKSS